MPSKRRPRLVILILIAFVVLGAIMATAPLLDYRIEWAGVTMLGALGIAMALMAWVLIVGSADE